MGGRGAGQVCGDGQRTDPGGEHTMQHADDVLHSCTLATHIILLTGVTHTHTPNKFNFKKLK